jgi:phosphoribosylformimino-5-aminoimidazole carboxamide ribotide isomerase
MLRRIVSAAPGLHVQAGGGVRDEAAVKAILEAGVQRVVIGTRAVADLPWLQALLAKPHLSGRVVLALDARDGVVATHGWTASAGVTALDVARAVSALPLAGILYTDVEKDGMLSGVNCAQTAALVGAATIPIIASGGVGSISHVREARRTGCWGVIVGRSLYEGTVDLREAIAAAA